MRYIVAVVIAALTLTTASYGQDRKFTIHSWGNNSCGKYLAAVHGHAPGAGKGFNDRWQGQFSDDHTLYMAWLGGFFSAMNVYVLDQPNEIQSDNAAIDVWIRKWCEQNPTKQLIDAASAFVWDQHKEYLQGWFARQAR
jgi:hypothetical protein